MNITGLLAWRNLWRHSRRTWLTVGAMVFCNTLLVFLIAIQLGSYRMMIDNTLSAFTGHLQVQHLGYLEEQKMRQTVPEAAALASRLAEEPHVEATAARAVTFALASSEQRSFGIQLTGVQPALETQVSSYPGLVSRGRYLQQGDDAAIVLGSILARNLKVAPGDEVTLLGSGYDGSVAAGVATVVGIIDSGLAEVDRGVAQAPLAWFQQVFALGDRAHSVVLRLDDVNRAPMLVPQIQASLPVGESLVALDWDQLQPGLREAIRSDMVSAWFMYGVLIVLVALSVLNTQLMSVLERTREFGVMLALGLRPQRLGRLVLLETIFLGLIGLLLGVALGALVVLYFDAYGFSYPGMAEAAARFNLPPRIYPQVSLLSLFLGPLTVFLGALLAAVYPALRLLRLQPVAAMRAV
ncbi:ABC transporter permease [Parahaliea maris]|uniref:ABC transporter permease n=1 Tax=Parahaliea maris TaxID=2716870 RepID=A0A5C9A022_9GAMM|nr:FtsX-like permease family protein [Parahaliea maris]TXS94213.1 ABC transporter permease [Parahaliea maris]